MPCRFGCFTRGSDPGRAKRGQYVQARAHARCAILPACRKMRRRVHPLLGRRGAVLLLWGLSGLRRLSCLSNVLHGAAAICCRTRYDACAGLCASAAETGIRAGSSCRRPAICRDPHRDHGAGIPIFAVLGARPPPRFFLDFSVRLRPRRTELNHRVRLALAIQPIKTFAAMAMSAAAPSHRGSEAGTPRGEASASFALARSLMLSARRAPC